MYEEAKVHFHLEKIGPSKASTIAASVGLARVKTYRILRKLVEERLVEFRSASPALHRSSSTRSAEQPTSADEE